MMVVLGVNLDDLSDLRPGQKAAAVQGRLPLVQAGLDKAMVRKVSQAFGLSTWDSSSGCVPGFEGAALHAGQPGARARARWSPVASRDVRPGIQLPWRTAAIDIRREIGP